jgi:hypothetical protein
LADGIYRVWFGLDEQSLVADLVEDGGASGFS